MEEGKKSKVAWSGRYRGQGNASIDTATKFQDLLDEIGNAIEEQAKNSGLNRFDFSIFREFEVIGTITANNITYFISPSVGGGLTRLEWHDFRQAPKQPTQDELERWIEVRYGWKEVCLIQLESNLLELQPHERKDKIQEVARHEVDEKIKEKEREARIVRINPIFQGRGFLLEDKLCFVLMPLKEPYLTYYKDRIKPILESLGLTVKNANDIKRSGSIIEDIWEYIYKARLIVADITCHNPNVFYELGIAHTIGKDCIFLRWSRDVAPVPFDIDHLRYFRYTDDENSWKSLRNILEEAVRKGKIH